MNFTDPSHEEMCAFLASREMVRKSIENDEIKEVVMAGFTSAMDALAKTFSKNSDGSPPNRITLTYYEITCVAAALLILDGKLQGDGIITEWIASQPMNMKEKIDDPR